MRIKKYQDRVAVSQGPVLVKGKAKDVREVISRAIWELKKKGGENENQSE
jgi:hypothetical protein